jgi:Lipocalin-like domain
MIALKDKLVSAWRLVKYEELPVDGSPATVPLGDRPHGYIIYSADAFMATFQSSTDETSKAEPIAYTGPFLIPLDPRGTRASPGFVFGDGRLAG